MTITLNGTTGITTPDVTSDSYTGAVAVNASAPNNSLVVDASGNVGIGTSSPASILHLKASSGNTVFHLTNSTTGTAISDGFSIISQAATNDAILSQRENANLIFRTADTERMRIDSSGLFRIGNSSGGNGVRLQVHGNTSVDSLCSFQDTRTDSYSGAPIMYFQRTSGTVGAISTTTTSTSYNTSSDYRLKEDWQPMTGASERVKALKPVNFAWKVDGSRVDGFLAHEAQAVVPEAVTGEKDAVDAEGKPVYQGIDQSKLVPLLTAALQEALAEIEEQKTALNLLKARVSALEAA